MVFKFVAGKILLQHWKQMAFGFLLILSIWSKLGHLFS